MSFRGIVLSLQAKYESYIIIDAYETEIILLYDGPAPCRGMGG